MNGKVFDENNQLIAQYFDVSVRIDHLLGLVSFYNSGDECFWSHNFKKILISQDEKEIIVYER